MTRKLAAAAAGAVVRPVARAADLLPKSAGSSDPRRPAQLRRAGSPDSRARRRAKRRKSSASGRRPRSVIEGGRVRPELGSWLAETSRAVRDGPSQAETSERPLRLLDDHFRAVEGEGFAPLRRARARARRHELANRRPCCGAPDVGPLSAVMRQISNAYKGPSSPSTPAVAHVFGQRLSVLDLLLAVAGLATASRSHDRVLGL